MQTATLQSKIRTAQSALKTISQMIPDAGVSIIRLDKIPEKTMQDYSQEFNENIKLPHISSPCFEIRIKNDFGIVSIKSDIIELNNAYLTTTQP